MSWTQEDVERSRQAMNNNKKKNNNIGGEMNLDDFFIFHLFLVEEFQKYGQKFSEYWDNNMTLKERRTMISCFAPYLPEYRKRMPTDPQLEGCFHLLPELNLEGLCSPSSSSYSLFGIYKWVVEMEFNVFLKDSVAHVKKMEEKGTLASDHKMRNHCWVITPDETFIVENWKMMKQEELWKTGEVVTLAVRNGVYQRLNGFYSILIAMIDEYRTEGLGDHKNRSISVMMGCSVCQKRSCDDGARLKSCGRCHRVWYCGRDCQVKHWPQHKSDCQKWSKRFA